MLEHSTCVVVLTTFPLCMVRPKRRGAGCLHIEVFISLILHWLCPSVLTEHDATHNHHNDLNFKVQPRGFPQQVCEESGCTVFLIRCMTGLAGLLRLALKVWTVYTVVRRVVHGPQQARRAGYLVLAVLD